MTAIIASAVVHSFLFVFSSATAATACPLAYEHTAHWIFVCLAILTSITTLYCIAYIVSYTRASYCPNISALILPALFWDLVIIPWAWGVHAVAKIQ